MPTPPPSLRLDWIVDWRFEESPPPPLPIKIFNKPQVNQYEHTGKRSTLARKDRAPTIGMSQNLNQTGCRSGTQNPKNPKDAGMEGTGSKHKTKKIKSKHKPKNNLHMFLDKKRCLKRTPFCGVMQVQSKKQSTHAFA